MIYNQPYNYTYPQYYSQPMPDQLTQLRNNGYMQQQQNMMQQQTPMQNQQIPGISPASRPVGNREEANAVPADFSGAPMVFPDSSHGRVYIKRWDYQRGSAVFDEYALVNQPQQTPVQAEPAPTTAGFATLDYVKSLEAEINALNGEIQRMKSEMKNGGTENVQQPIPANHSDV